MIIIITIIIIIMVILIYICCRVKFEIAITSLILYSYPKNILRWKAIKLPKLEVTYHIEGLNFGKWSNKYVQKCGKVPSILGSWSSHSMVWQFNGETSLTLPLMDVLYAINPYGWIIIASIHPCITLW